MAELRSCHAVLWDVHGGLLDHNTDPPSLAPGERRAKWAKWTGEALLEAGCSSELILEEQLEPLVFWRRRMQEEIKLLEAQSAGGQSQKTVSHKRFQEMVNVALLQSVAPEFIGGLPLGEQVRLARRLWKKRRTDQALYILHPDMRELIHWLGDRMVGLCLITAQARNRAEQLLRSCNLPWSRFVRLYAAGEMGLPKSHPAFWTMACARLGFATGQVVCIEDNLSLGLNVVRSGMALFLCDRDSAIQNFLREEYGGQFGGAPVLGVTDQFPQAGPFVVCAATPQELHHIFEGLKLGRNGNGHD